MDFSLSHPPNNLKQDLYRQLGQQTHQIQHEFPHQLGNSTASLQENSNRNQGQASMASHHAIENQIKPTKNPARPATSTSSLRQKAAQPEFHPAGYQFMQSHKAISQMIPSDTLNTQGQNSQMNSRQLLAQKSSEKNLIPNTLHANAFKQMPLTQRTIGRDITQQIANTNGQSSQIFNGLARMQSHQENTQVDVKLAFNSSSSSTGAPAVIGKKPFRVNQVNAPQSIQNNTHSQRFFSKEAPIQKAPTTFIGASLIQKHALVLEQGNSQGASTTTNAKLGLKTTKSGSQSILIPRGTQAPNHKTHLDQSRIAVRQQKSSVDEKEIQNFGKPALQNNFMHSYESNNRNQVNQHSSQVLSSQTVQWQNGLHQAPKQVRLMHPQDQSKLLKTTISTIRIDDPKYSDKSGQMFENHYYEEGVSKYQNTSLGSSFPQIADENMSIESNNVRERLAYFWSTTAKQVQMDFASQLDHPDLENPQLVAEHAGHILRVLFQEEKQALPSPHYMQQQQDINEKMRAILVDWIIEVHLKFKLLPETLFITVSLIDRFLELEQIKRTNLQLVGVTAMLIASKYEEIYAPEVRDFVYITDNAYTKEEILQMEQSMLSKLDFNITVPSAFRFLERFSRLANANSKQWNLARYLIELPLIEQRMLKYCPSLIAASAMYLSRKITQGNDAVWTQELQLNSGYSEQDMRQCAKDMCILLGGIERCTLQAVRKKFSLQRFMEVALIRIESPQTV